MPKIVKNGKEYSGVPIECVTAWQPTGDPVQVAEPLMGNTDISDIGDGTITGAVSSLSAGLMNYSDEVICGYLGSTPVYRTVLTGVSVPNGTITSLSSLGIVKVVRIYGSAFSGTSWFGIPFYDSSSNKCTVYYNPTTKNLGGWADKTFTNATIFLEYTKE